MSGYIRGVWVEALRSGKYKQCTGMMHLGDAFDPFGVLYDVTGVEWVWLGHYDNGREVYAADGRRDQSPGWQQLQSWGIAEGAAHNLTVMSDGGRDFAYLADWIEANIPVTRE